MSRKDPMAIDECDDDAAESNLIHQINGAGDQNHQNNNPYNSETAEMAEERRQIRSEYRALLTETEERRQEFIRPSVSADNLLRAVRQANQLFDRVKTTNEATLDAKLLVTAADLGLRRSLKASKTARSFDVVDFLNRVRQYMLTAPLNAPAPINVAATASSSNFKGDEDFKGDEEEAGKEHQINDDNEEEMSSETENWSKLGMLAMRYSRQVPSLTLMLGPLSVEPKQKRQINARQRQQDKDDKGPVEFQQPEKLAIADVQKGENESSAFVRHLHSLLEENGSMPYWQFVLHPTSFAQTVENMFYTSFLIRDARVYVGAGTLEDADGNEIPVEFPDSIIRKFSCLVSPPIGHCLEVCDPPDEESRVQMPKYHYMSDIDLQSWKILVQQYEIQTPIIPDRGY